MNVSVEYYEPYSDSGLPIRRKGGRKYYGVYVGGVIVSGPMRRPEAERKAAEIRAAHRRSEP